MTIKKAQRLGVKDEVVGAGCHDSIPRFAVCILNHWTSFQCAMHTRPGTPKIQPITKHHSRKKNPSAHPMCCAYKATPNSLVLAIIVSISSLSRLICCAMLPTLSNHDAERVHAFVQQNMHYYPIFNCWMDATQKRITGRLFFWQAEDHYAWRDLMSAMMQLGIVTAVHEASSPSISSNPPSVHTSNVQPGPLPSHQSFARTPPPGSGQLELNPHMNPTFGQPACSASRALGSPNVIAQPISPDTHGAEARKKRQREPMQGQAMMDTPKNEHDARKARKKSISKDANDIKRSGTKSISKDENDINNCTRKRRTASMREDGSDIKRQTRTTSMSKDGSDIKRRTRTTSMSTDGSDIKRRTRTTSTRKDGNDIKRRTRTTSMSKDGSDIQRQRTTSMSKDGSDIQRRTRRTRTTSMSKDGSDILRCTRRTKTTSMSKGERGGLMHWKCKGCATNACLDQRPMRILPTSSATSLTTWKWSVNIVTLYVGVPSGRPFVAVADK